jgi:uncharacterized damage-inducible protein DinB
MADTTTLTRSELLQRLREGGEDALKRLRALPPGDFEAGRYENGWNARQILAHIASIEWTYPRLIDMARGEAAPAAPTAPAPAATPGQPAGRILSYNDRQVEKRAGNTVEQLIDEFETNRAATIAAVESAEEELFSRPVRSAGGATGTLAEVLNYVAVQHVAMHVNDITGA